MTAGTRRASGVGARLAEIFTPAQVIDLTVPLDETLPCTWPGHMPFRATVSTWFTDRPDDPQPVHAGDGAYQTRWLVLDEHTGTHVDAARHFVPPPGSGLPNAGPAGRVGVADLPLLAASGPACVIDVRRLLDTSSPGTSPPITAAHIAAWESQCGPLAEGDVVLFRTGWDRYYRPGAAGAHYGADVLTTGTVCGWPAPTAETVRVLVERGVRCIGIDGLSIGPAEDGAPTHLAGLRDGAVFVEALTRLDRLPYCGSWFLFLPLRLVGGTGGPGRAIAVVERS
ncbi:MAG TPA: cyclase family protein [Jatrophihabitans sp.]|nr:cyclase family protein [Jatrophihabitans sp.]